MSELNGRNGKGKNGSVAVETIGRKGDRALSFDGMKLQVGQKVAEELMAALSTSLRPWQGYSIFDRINQELDVILDRLMSGDPAEDGRDPGRAEAFTRCLAIIRNPYKPDYPEEKERQMERWRDRNGETDA